MTTPYMAFLMSNIEQSQDGDLEEIRMIKTMKVINEDTYLPLIETQIIKTIKVLKGDTYLSLIALSFSNSN